MKSKLIAKFKKVTNPDKTINHRESCWQLFADDKLITTLTVNDISGGRSEELYHGIATLDFGRNLINAFKNRSSNKVMIPVALTQTAPVEFVIQV